MIANLTFTTSADITIGRPPPGDIERGAPYRISTGAVSWYATQDQAGALIETLRDAGWSVESEPALVAYPTFTTLRPPTHPAPVVEASGPTVTARILTPAGEIRRWSDGTEELVPDAFDAADESGAEA